MMKRIRHLFALLLALSMLVAWPAGAQQALAAELISWESSAQHEWYSAFVGGVHQASEATATQSHTFTAKANVARLAIYNEHLTKLTITLNGEELDLAAHLGAPRQVLRFDVSSLVRYGENTIKIESAGPSGANALVFVEVPRLTARILHMNDIHAKIDTLPAAAAYIKAVREQGGLVYFVNGGDNFSGGPVSDLNKGEPMIEVMNEMDPTVMAVGNHEFDHGPEATQKRREESTFPWLSANTAVADPNATPIRPFDPYLIVTTELGQKIAFIGLTETPPATAIKNQVGLHFEDPVKVAQKYVDELKNQVNLIVLVSHNGFDFDKKLAAEVKGVDLIIGAHSHTYLSQPHVENGVPIVQVGSDGRWVGDLKLSQGFAVTLSGGAAKGAYTVANQDLKQVDPAVKAIVDEWTKQMAPILDEKIFAIDEPMSNADRYKHDIALGNLITDAMRDAMGTEIAFTNNGGIRASIPAGDVTMRHIYTVLPFGNFIVKMNLTGAQLQKALEYSYTRRNQLDLQTSGLTYTIYTKADGSMDRMEILVNGEPLDPERTYSVALQDFLANGGSGYPFPEFGQSVDQAPEVDALIVANYVKKVGEVDYAATEGRIQLKPVE